jgi:protein tyrosine/serine phosphatase
VSRTLAWDGLLNVRDLGGLATEDGARTRMGAVIRADNVRRLRDAQILLDHGVSRIVDLRFPAERAADAIDELPVEVVHVSLLGDWADDYARAIEDRMLRMAAPAYLRWSYLEFLDRFHANFGAAVRAVAGAPPGAVCVHCMGGRDRTGLVSALLLRLAGVARADVGADYAESEARLAEDHARWVAEARDDDERARRAVFAHAPAHVMEEVLADLEGRHGSVSGYLAGAGLTAAELDAVRARLREAPAAR